MIPVSIKRIIELGFSAHTPSFEARVRPLLHQSIPQGIKNSDVVEIKAVGYKVSNDTADAMRLIGNRTTAEIIIKNKGYYPDHRPYFSHLLGLLFLFYH